MHSYLVAKRVNGNLLLISGFLNLIVEIQFGKPVTFPFRESLFKGKSINGKTAIEILATSTKAKLIVSIIKKKNLCRRINMLVYITSASVLVYQYD